MRTECNPDLFGFAPVEGRRVEAAFDAGLATSDAGALLPGATDRTIGLIGRFAGCFVDHREQALIEHEVRTLVGQRVFGIALGYEDLEDHDVLRHDPVMAALAGKLEAKRRDCAPVAGKSTLNRLELSTALPTLYHKISYRAGAIEALFVTLILEAQQRPPAQIRAHWPQVRILLRGDSGFARENLMAWCEANRVDFLFGLQRNARLVAEIAAELAAARAAATRRPARRYRDFLRTTLDSWSRRRRVVGKAEWMPGRGDDGANPRFVVTSLARHEIKARRLYERLYCARGEMENRIKECQLFAPQLDLDEILHAGQRRAQHQKQNLRQRVDHPPGLARVLQRREMIEKRLWARRLGHCGASWVNEAPHESHRPASEQPSRRPYPVNLKRLP